MSGSHLGQEDTDRPHSTPLAADLGNPQLPGARGEVAAAPGKSPLGPELHRSWKGGMGCSMTCSHVS